MDLTATPGAKMLYLIRRRETASRDELVANWFANHMPAVIAGQHAQAERGGIHATRYMATLFESRPGAGLSPAAAATVILDGVKADAQRIRGGDDAAALERAVRAAPEDAHDLDFFARVTAEAMASNAALRPNRQRKGAGT